MPDYLLLMHDDATEGGQRGWDAYIAALQADGRFQGGSAMGPGASFRKTQDAGPVAAHLVGFVRISAASLEDARRALEGNPVYEAGGTVEIRQMPETA